MDIGVYRAVLHALSDKPEPTVILTLQGGHTIEGSACISGYADTPRQVAVIQMGNKEAVVDIAAIMSMEVK